MFLQFLISIVCLVLRRDKLDGAERDLEGFVQLVNAVLALGKSLHSLPSSASLVCSNIVQLVWNWIPLLLCPLMPNRVRSRLRCKRET